MRSPLRAVGVCVLSASALWVCACASGVQASSASSPSSSLEGSISYPTAASDPLSSYSQTGDVQPVHDPSIIRQGNTYYAFTTDVIGLPPSNYLPIRCSADKVNWTAC